MTVTPGVWPALTLSTWEDTHAAAEAAHWDRAALEFKGS